MRLKDILHFSIISIILFLPQYSCRPFDSGESEKIAGSDGDVIKYHSASNRGKWKREGDDHVPQYSVRYDEIYKYIDVSVLFKGTKDPLHYVEVIVLTDHNHNEIQKTEILPGTAEPKASFKLPVGYKSSVFIVLKCNLHDMWEAKVVWDE